MRHFPCWTGRRRQGTPVANRSSRGAPQVRLLPRPFRPAIRGVRRGLAEAKLRRSANTDVDVSWAVYTLLKIPPGNVPFPPGTFQLRGSPVLEFNGKAIRSIDSGGP